MGRTGPAEKRYSLTCSLPERKKKVFKTFFCIKEESARRKRREKNKSRSGEYRGITSSRKRDVVTARTHRTVKTRRDRDIARSDCGGESDIKNDFPLTDI